MLKNLSKIIIVLLILLFLGYLIYSNKKTINVIDSSEYIQKIDSLESIIDSLSIKKDSIDVEIDTIYIMMNKNIQKYEENRNIILDNNVCKNYKFFSEYIIKYKSRYDSVNNF